MLTRLIGRSSTLVSRSWLSRCVVVARYHEDHGVYGYKPTAWKQNHISEDTVSPDAQRNCANNAPLVRLVEAYRYHGHKKAKVDALDMQKPKPTPELDPAHYGLSTSDDMTFDLTGILNVEETSASLTDIIQYMERMYCGRTSVELMNLPTIAEREWCAHRYEELHRSVLSNEAKTELAVLLAKAQALENFMAVKFTTVKRYGGEGAESMMGFFQQLLRQAAQSDLEQMVLCMPHRGRLILQVGLLQLPASLVFRKMSGLPEYPASSKDCTGDILTHLYQSVDLEYDDDKLHFTMIPNPSHLEANLPVCMGKSRSRQQSLHEGDYSQDEGSSVGDRVLCVHVHGDAAYAAQGMANEMQVLAELPHYNVGGAIHLVVNNQLGFTTPANRGRSCTHCTDIAKLNGNLVLHVNGDYPEEVVKASQFALEYQQKFRRDVFVDLQCFRRLGHNEVDDPSFTQPAMYNIIRNRTSVPDLYLKEVTEAGEVDKSEIDAALAKNQEEMSQCLKAAKTYEPQPTTLSKQWSGFVEAPAHITSWDTGVDVELLRFVAAKSVELPEDFTPHNHLIKTFLEARRKKVMEGAAIDWATAEAMAFGSLLYQGFNVRLSGQDVGRGTFSHRHAMLVDQTTDSAYVPLNHITPDQKAFLEVVNSPLSEEATLGFEYGMSIESPNNLIIWEAQFGDFFNGAQTIVDTYVTAGEVKWRLQSGLVMLLPHGFDGAGPEHSSSHLERFLLQTDSKEDAIDGDNVNFMVVHPTTPAQYFHLLRRQMVRNFRKPLIVASPKILLRLPEAVSSLAEVAPGTSFVPVIGDTTTNPKQVERVIFCSGKHYYALRKQREQRQAKDNTAIIRVEALCPFPAEEVQRELDKYPNAKEFIWSQEEHRNMGAWTFVAPRFENLAGCKLRYAGRRVLGTPAVGVATLHQEEVKQIMEDTFR
ncbi:probable 2-oxoglutarate dehydrogenase E1 component DHKTD1, mitochondrial [Patiria miniata]|uniref:Transketolase-like pyrimidine-binding domain-containing protein n=1 Tax=Patiria miniata TaxID=46514 RepID=A0A914BAY7_PATMI|nr:probable 2-oxoglutarate dehydrogenase E1 component DHKTD1, mitochondrial [Patiria miniata]